MESVCVCRHEVDDVEDEKVEEETSEEQHADDRLLLARLGYAVHNIR